MCGGSRLEAQQPMPRTPNGDSIVNNFGTFSSSSMSNMPVFCESNMFHDRKRVLSDGMGVCAKRQRYDIVEMRN